MAKFPQAQDGAATGTTAPHNQPTVTDKGYHRSSTDLARMSLTDISTAIQSYSLLSAASLTDSVRDRLEKVVEEIKSLADELEPKPSS